MGSYLSALTPDAAARQVFPNPPRSSKPGHNMVTFNQMVMSAQAGQIMTADGSGPAYVPGTGSCSASKGVGKAVLVAATGTAGGLLLKIGASSANPILIAAGGAAEIASLIFGAIFGHHAAAVAKEQSILCAAVPAANNALQVIDQAVQSGQFTPQQGIDALNATLSGFRQAVAPIIHGADPAVSGECNAACVMLSCLRAIVLVKQSQYQDLATAASSPVSYSGAPASISVPAIVSTLIASTGLPSWVPYAFGGLLLWKLLD